MSDYPTPKTRCLTCGYPITWAAQRQQFGRLCKRGLEPEEIRQIMPRCQKCVTRCLRERCTSRKTPGRIAEIAEPALQQSTDESYPGLAPFLRERLQRRDRRRAAVETEVAWFDLRPPHINRVRWRAMSDEQRAAALEVIATGGLGRDHRPAGLGSHQALPAVDAHSVKTMVVAMASENATFSEA